MNLLPMFVTIACIRADAPATQPTSQPATITPRVLWSVPLKSHSFGTAAAADIDGDGQLEIAFATYFGDSAVHVLRGRDGKEAWKWQGKDECLDASLKFCDVTGDGKLDLVVPVSNTSLVLCLDARTGKQNWRYEAGHAECIDTPPTIVDFDGDKQLDVLIGTFKGNVHVIRGKDGSLVRKFKAAPSFVQSEVITLDCDTDGTLDAIVGNFRGDNCVHAVSGKDDRGIWKVQTGNWIYHGPAVGDLDGDGKPDLAIGSYDGKVYAFRSNAKPLWTARPGDRYFMGPMTIADLDGDRKPEVISASQRITAIRGDGSTLWSVPADDSNGFESVTRGVSVADLNGDGRPDLAYLNGKGLFRAVNGRDGSLICEFNAQSLSLKPLHNGSCGVTIADLNGDGNLDCFFVVGGGGEKMNDGTDKPRFGYAIALTGFTGRGPGWTMMRNDLLNTGNVCTTLKPAS